jgi:hypothetical protein
LRINFRTMMRVHNEMIDADFQEMIHYVSDDRTPSDLQERFRKSLRQRPKPRPQSSTQDESRLESSSFQFSVSTKDGFFPEYSFSLSFHFSIPSPMPFSFRTPDRSSPAPPR